MHERTISNTNTKRPEGRKCPRKGETSWQTQSH
jgi:hypothetical protein